MSITETVLEMHYHRPLMDLFRETYGLGSSGHINFYKYSPQREVFIGFDQAFAMTELSTPEFFDLLSSSAMNSGYKLPARFVGYFLQFKVVSELKKIMKATPPGITNRPHYRASLDTTKNDTTGFSQHELLFNLNRNDGAMVYYACPMVFDKSALYEVSVEFDRLRLADLDTCPGAFTDNSNHYIYFNDQNSEPVWCSDPVPGKAISPRQLVERLSASLKETPPEASAERVRSMLTRVRGLGEIEVRLQSPPEGTRNSLAAIADSLTVIQVQEGQ